MISDNARCTEEFRNAARLELGTFLRAAISLLTYCPFRQMQPAFAGAIVLPPPAPVALGFAGAERARARRAADRRETFGMQGVDRYVVAAGLRQNGGACPIIQRIELEQ